MKSAEYKWVFLATVALVFVYNERNEQKRARDEEAQQRQIERLEREHLYTEYEVLFTKLTATLDSTKKENALLRYILLHRTPTRTPTPSSARALPVSEISEM